MFRWSGQPFKALEIWFNIFVFQIPFSSRLVLLRGLNAVVAPIRKGEYKAASAQQHGKHGNFGPRACDRKGGRRNGRQIMSQCASTVDRVSKSFSIIIVIYYFYLLSLLRIIDHYLRFFLDSGASLLDLAN